MENFTLVSAFSGGLLIGLAATLLLLFNGRIAGISGMLGGLITTSGAERYWRLAFLLGILLGAYGFSLIRPDLIHLRTNYPIWLLALGGFLVGFGTRLGNGCTSGHAICGLARLSVRSLAATVTFMLFGFISVYVVRHLLNLG